MERERQHSRALTGVLFGFCSALIVTLNLSSVTNYWTLEFNCEVQL